jgi:hypothetical protein
MQRGQAAARLTGWPGFQRRCTVESGTRMPALHISDPPCRTLYYLIEVSCSIHPNPFPQAWIFDEYTKFAGFSPGIVTGKVCF